MLLQFHSHDFMLNICSNYLRVRVKEVHFRADRCDRRAGGLLTSCKDSMHVKLLCNINVPGLESV